MILQALCDLYERLRETPDSGIALPGFGPQSVSFALVVDKDGSLVRVDDIRDTSGKKARPISLMLPEATKRSSGIAANFMWDNSGTCWGLDDKGNPDRSLQTFEAFRQHQHRVGDGVNDAGMKAVLVFLDNWNPKKPPKGFPAEEIIGQNVVFRLDRERQFVHERKAVTAAWSTYSSDAGDEQRGTCLVTGEEADIARLHPKIKGVRDAQSTGAALVSFNLDAFRSYGKEQSFNAPIGQHAAFAYTTALNHLLRFDSRQKIQIGDSTTVFWTERSSPIEDFLGNVLDPRADSSVSAADAQKIADYLSAVRRGVKSELVKDDSIRFYILGLAPNASRLSVRFWYVDTVECLNRHIGCHFADIETAKEYDNQHDFPGIWQLLVETAVLRKSENINPTLAGAMMRSILEGIPYPASLLAEVIDRIRADHDINYYRAALIKGTLVRNYNAKEVTMALNEGSEDTPYRLGRLFAVLEKAQEEAIPTANATIKDRFFGAASATPSVVFPQLIRLSQHHLAKLEPGPKIHKEQLIQSILDGLDAAKGFPAHLRLEEQGMFALGYYHQRKAFFTKKDPNGAAG